MISPFLTQLLTGQNDAQRFQTPGINPAAPPLPQVSQPPQGVTGKLDQFIGTPGGSFLLNLLSQSGYSTTPSSPLGAIGRAGLMTQQQGMDREKLDAEIALRNAQIEKLGSTNQNRIVQSAQTLANGNIGYLDAFTGKVVDTGVKAAGKGQIIDMPGLGQVEYNPVTQKLTQVNPEDVIQAGTRGRKESAAAGTVSGQMGQERIENLPKTIQAAEGTIRSIDNVIDEVSRGLDLVGPSSTGALGALLSNIPGTDAFSLGKVRETIKSNIGFDRLNEMRRVSPTGASGLGQLSTVELDGLQNGLTNLDQAQSQGDVKRALTKVLTHYENWKAIMEQHKFDERRRAGEANILPPGFSEAE